MAILFQVLTGPYTNLAVLLLGMAFFSHAAREEGRSRGVYAALSLGAWVVVTRLFLPGAIGGIASQVMLFVGLAAFDVWREFPRHPRRAPEGEDGGRRSERGD